MNKQLNAVILAGMLLVPSVQAAMPDFGAMWTSVKAVPGAILTGIKATPSAVLTGAKATPSALWNNKTKTVVGVAVVSAAVAAYVKRAQIAAYVKACYAKYTTKA